MRRWSMVSVEEVRCVSTSSAAELTLITSWVPATDKTMGISACCPTVIDTFFTVARAKPGASTVTVYCAGGSNRMWYWPSAFSLVARSSPLVSSRAVTRGVGHQAPLRVPDGDMQIAG